MKKVDIDTLLSQNKLALTLGGKVFEVDDIEIATFMDTASSDVKKDKDILHKQLAVLLKVDRKELKGIGIKASSLALNAIREWLVDTSPDTVPEKAGESEPKND